MCGGFVIKRENYGVLSGVIGIALNIALFIFKILYSAKANSLSMQADAFNNLMDIASSMVVVLSFAFAKTKPDREHPFGHGRIEQIAGFAISIIILFTGFELGKSSIERIINPQVLVSSKSVYIVLIVSIIAKVLVSIFNFTLGKRINSTTLIVNAKDSSSDVIATLSVLVSLVIFDLSGKNLDAYAGLIVSLMILYAGYQAAKETISPLLGEALSKEQREEISEFVLKNAEVLGVHDIMLHNYGAKRSIITMHMEVDAKLCLVDVHEQADMLERKIKKRWGYKTLIHIDPINEDETEEKAMLRQELSAVLYNINSSISYHDFSVHNKNGKITLIFDVYAPYEIYMQKQELEDKIKQDLLSKLGDKYNYSIDINRY